MRQLPNDLLIRALGNTVDSCNKALREYLGAKQMQDDEMCFLPGFPDAIILHSVYDNNFGFTSITYCIPQRLPFVELHPKFAGIHAITRKEFFNDGEFTLIVIDAL